MRRSGPRCPPASPPRLGTDFRLRHCAPGPREGRTLALTALARHGGSILSAKRWPCARIVDIGDASWPGSVRSTWRPIAGMAPTAHPHLAAGLARTRTRHLRRAGGLYAAGSWRGGWRVSTAVALPPSQTGQRHLLVYSPRRPSGQHCTQDPQYARHSLAWRDLRRAVPAIDVSATDVLVGWPPAFELARRLHPHRLIYDCLDLFPSFDDGLRGRLLASLEEELSRAAFAVVVTSRDLERRWSTRHPRVVRIPNGVDLSLFGPGAAPAAVPSRSPGSHALDWLHGTSDGGWTCLPTRARQARMSIALTDRSAERRRPRRRTSCCGRAAYASFRDCRDGRLAVPFR